MLVAPCSGFVIAGFFAWSWTRWGHRLNLGVILKVTALFLGLFLIQLLVYGVHELAESGVIHGSQGFHDATEMFGPRRQHRPLAVVFAACSRRSLYLLFARLSKPGNRPPPASTVRAAAVSTRDSSR